MSKFTFVTCYSGALWTCTNTATLRVFESKWFCNIHRSPKRRVAARYDRRLRRKRAFFLHIARTLITSRFLLE